MSFIANRLTSIAPAETMAMAARAAQLRAQGLDVICLSQGEPDFPTPGHLQQAAMQAMHAGKTRYTEGAGVAPLREAVVAAIRSEHGLQYALEDVTITVGAKQAIFNAFFATLNPGDEVLIPAPCWGSYPEIVKLTGGVPVVMECPREAGFKLQPAQMEANITAVAALSGDQACVAQFRAAFKRRRDVVVQAVRGTPGLSVDVPEGAFYVYVSCRELLGRHTRRGEQLRSDRDFVRYLLEEAQVAVVSGTGFLHSPYLRASYAASVEHLQEATRRIRHAVERLS